MLQRRGVTVRIPKGESSLTLLPVALACSLLAGPARAELPACVRADQAVSTQAALAGRGVDAAELLARLAYAEGLSTGFPDQPLVYRAIAWGVMNRVRLGRASPGARRTYGAGVAGVIFRRGQSNPAVSRASRFSAAFLCPDKLARWRLARQAAAEALAGERNPFLQTTWEREHGLSLVVNFYYPHSVQARGPLAPWEDSPELRFVGDVVLDGQVLPAAIIRFYRLTRPPADLPRPALQPTTAPASPAGPTPAASPSRATPDDADPAKRPPAR